ncbi:phosphomannomutase, putative [Entamoeba dispar SAW760]|uniref:Phosphomannomutase n=1 Tax=Entamoeba dispar (strain ATCC PRA-260 / SAW760) TaxID=370354 RepID=B0EJG5_ENTDS|nr:phosphomannomutase, putative [Entamoeba dispar SAW760]EDR25287.1 phosphomannomutase, putative [Entamoeba dispar SAW760]|eukprot:EDR25287.1 phosphomannomutase, putative [Entamoeba dispar SAW760]
MNNTILLFDMDGTLTKPRNKITQEMKTFLQEAGKKIDLGVVSGSDLPKLKEQLGDDVTEYFRYVFCENGLVTYKDGVCIGKLSFKEHVGQERYNKLINYILMEISKIDIPIKTGTFIELRSGNLNVSPIGRNCSQEEREEFFKYDKEHHIREQLIEKIKKEFNELNLVYAIGGQISFDCYPVGWDKTYSLNYIKDKYSHFEFFGDRTMKGGNDYEMAQSSLINKVHQVNGPEDVMKIMKEMGL